jgi:hypothetical protein
LPVSLRYNLLHPASYMHDLGRRMYLEFGGEAGCEGELSFWAVCEPILVPRRLKSLLRIWHVFGLVDAN